MANRHVWIAQCLCPQRHCILAAAGAAEDARDAEEHIANPLRTRMAGLLKSGAINAWCGLCHSPADSWRYEIGSTRFASMEEAAEALRRSEREQAVTRAVWGDLPQR